MPDANLPPLPSNIADSITAVITECDTMFHHPDWHTDVPFFRAELESHIASALAAERETAVARFAPLLAACDAALGALNDVPDFENGTDLRKSKARDVGLLATEILMEYEKLVHPDVSDA